MKSNFIKFVQTKITLGLVVNTIINIMWVTLVYYTVGYIFNVYPSRKVVSLVEITYVSLNVIGIQCITLLLKHLMKKSYNTLLFPYKKKS